MKKLVSSVLVLCMIAVALAGCGNKNTETTKATEATASTEAAVSTEAVSETQAAEGEAATVQVYIAASLSNAMDEISANYKSVQPNVDLVFNAGSSGKLQTQIEEGGACDVFFSAATKQMNALVEGGYVQEADVTDLLENKVQRQRLQVLRILQMRQTLHLQLTQFLLASMQERFLTTLVLQIR